MTIAVVFVAVCRIDLVKEDLAVKLAKESLNQFEDALVEFFTLSAILHLFIDRDIAARLKGRLSERGLLYKACSRMGVHEVHRNRLIAL